MVSQLKQPGSSTPNQVQEIQAALLSWYDMCARELPWRDTVDPYAIWISEVMLQQTQVKTVIPYYTRFMQKFPTMKVLAAAGADELARTWAGLGYYRRVRNLQAAAQQVLLHHGGEVPRDWQAFRSLPGVGDYTAGAVLSIAYQQHYTAVDGNVKRVLARLFAITEPLDKTAALARVRQFAEVLLPWDSPGTFNQALMELGALVCKPKQPQCVCCPLHNGCLAYMQGKVTQIPVRSPRKKPQPVVRVSGVVRYGDKLLFMRRKPGLLGGYFELPSWQLVAGEQVEQGLEQLVQVLKHHGFAVTAGNHLGIVEHTFSHQHWQVHLYSLDYASMETGKNTVSPNPVSAIEVHEAAGEYAVSGHSAPSNSNQPNELGAVWLAPQQVRKTGLPVALRKILDQAIGP